MAKLAAIIFDLDGTLYTSSALAAEIHRVACSALAQQLGGSSEEAGTRLAAAKAGILAATGREVTLSAACLELGCDIRELHRYLAGKIDPEPFLTRDSRVVAMLERLSGRYPIYIYTNNNSSLATRIIKKLGLDGCIRKTFAIDGNWCAKPDKKGVEAILAEIGVSPGQSLFVGDRYDVDLRIPAELGSSVFLTRTVEELLTLEEFIHDNGD